MKSRKDHSLFLSQWQSNRSLRVLFLNRGGKVHLVWALAAGYAGYLASVTGFTLLYWYGYNSMMNIWGVTARNVQRAPAWAQLLISGSPSLVAVIQNALVVLVSALLWRAFERGRLLKPMLSGRGASVEAGWGALWGLISILLVGAALLISDSSRLGWRLSSPHFSAMIWVLVAVSLAAAVGEEVFCRGYVMGMTIRRTNRLIGYAVSMAVYALMHGTNGGITALSLLNWLLMGLACALMFDLTGRIAMGVGFRFAWIYLTQAIAGFPGGNNAMYEIYASSRYWLNGGDAGVMYGALVTVLLLALCMGLWLMLTRKHTRDRSAA